MAWVGPCISYGCDHQDVWLIYNRAGKRAGRNRKEQERERKEKGKSRKDKHKQRRKRLLASRVLLGCYFVGQGDVGSMNHTGKAESKQSSTVYGMSSMWEVALYIRFYHEYEVLD